MSKILLMADIHLGVTNRLKDILWSLNVTYQYCIKNDIDTIIILGDLFHDRESINIDVLCEAFKFFRKAKDAGQQWIAFPGNHDMFLKHSWEYTSLQPISDLITIISDVKILDLDGSRFWILPFIFSESAYMRVVNKINEHYEEGDVLLTHIGVKTAILNICFLLQDWSMVDLSKTKFDQIFSGHFHTSQQVKDNLWYVGSPIPFKFDEGDHEHGFIEYDLSTREHCFIDIWKAAKKLDVDGTPPPQYHTFHDELLDEKTEGEVFNNMIRVALTREYAPQEKEDIRKRFMDWGARRITFFDLIVDETSIISGKNDPSTYTVPADRLFLKWLRVESENDNLKNFNEDLLKKLNNEIMSEGDEAYHKLRLEE